MKKILSIFAASAAALSSVMSSVPVNAQSAVLPVEVEVTPAIFLRTYERLKFVVSQQDLTSGSSIEQSGAYDEKAGVDQLSTDFPSGQATDTITKEIPRLYQVWGNGVTDANILVEASQPTLTSGTPSTNPFGGFNNPQQTVTMSVTKGNLTPAQNAQGAQYQEGGATIGLQFSNASAASGTVYTGGEITIRITNP